jgi:hypothetical protein
MTNYENFYYGSESVMPAYNPVGYQVDFGQLGTTLDARSANQLGELNHKVNPGVKNVEIGVTGAAELESVPKQHFDEMNRLMKLTGTKASFHAPIIEASGVGQQGWDETSREAAERQLAQATLKSHQLDPDGNISVTVHSTAQLPELTPKFKTKTKDGEIVEEQGPFWIISPSSGKIGQLPREKRYFPEKGEFKGEVQKFEPEKEIDKYNGDAWMQQLSEVNRFSSYGEEMVEKVLKGKDQEQQQAINDFLELKKQGQLDIANLPEEMDAEFVKEKERQINHGQIYLRDSYRNLKGLFNQAFEGATGKDKEKLSKFANEIAPIVQEGFENDPTKLTDFADVIEKGLKILGSIEKAPRMYEPLNDFVLDKSAETFANVAQESFEKFGDTSPIINIENPPAGGGLSRAEDLKELIEISRKKFTENMIKKGLSKSEAKAASEKIIGATWDIGHINMLRKQGYTEKDIIKQTEIIAPFVKHVHLSDNFGMEHTELPMGMGNVPTKEILAKLGEKGFKGKKIIEAGNWWQHFAEKGGGNPLKPTIENFDSPIYAMQAGPSWSQTGIPASYYSGQGPINPQIHHSLYGGSFLGLPAEFGGEMPGAQSRFSGTPNA